MTIDKPLVILQARVTSSRFRNKVLTKLDCGLTVLEILIKRLRCYSSNYSMVVAIPDTKENEQLADFLTYKNVQYFKGSEEDVLSRFYNCAKQAGANTILRINSDCPLIDPVNIVNIINAFAETDNIYMSTILDNSFPLGEHIEIFTYEALELAFLHARTVVEKEHVTPFIYNKLTSRCTPFKSNISLERLNNVRLCIDYKEDLILINRIIDNFFPRYDFQMEEILDLLYDNPELKAINSFYMKPRTLDTSS